MQEAFEHCADQVRRFDKDRFLASQFAPAEARPHLLSLYAFNIEMARVREVVSNPMPGEIRLQWWRDALSGSRREEVANHPVGNGLLQTIRRFGLPVQALINLIDARIFDLYDDPMPTLNDLEGYAGETASALIQLAALVLAEGNDPGTHEVAGHAGVAHAMTGILRMLPIHASRGQCFIPRDLLARHDAGPEDIVAGRATIGVRNALADLRTEAHRHLGSARALAGGIPDRVMPAFLPIALAEPYLSRLADPDRDPFKGIIDIPAWLRPLTLWRAARSRSF